MDKFFKFLPFDQPFCPDEQHERTVWLSEQFVDLIDSNVAILGSFGNRQRDLLKDWNFHFI